jgi:hypothetical protein
MKKIKNEKRYEKQKREEEMDKNRGNKRNEDGTRENKRE